MILHSIDDLAGADPLDQSLYPLIPSIWPIALYICAIRLPEPICSSKLPIAV
jgi:hypothetical protein